MYVDHQLSFLIVTKTECPEFISVTFPEGGLGYLDEMFGEYYIVETAESEWPGLDEPNAIPLHDFYTIAAWEYRHTCFECKGPESARTGQPVVHYTDSQLAGCEDGDCHYPTTNEHGDAWCYKCGERLLLPGYAGGPELVTT